MRISELKCFTVKSPLSEYNRSLHTYAVFVASITLILIYMGGLIKTIEAGLSVPDWPLSYGGWNPPRWFEVESIRAEHGHRLMAQFVGLNILILNYWVWKKTNAEKWFKKLVLWSLITVLIQGLLGGLTVLFYLPVTLSMAHGFTGQMFFLINLSIAVMTSKHWIVPERKLEQKSENVISVHWLINFTVLSLMIQLLLGAWVRHTESGLAIADFPLSNGQIIPQFTDIHIISAFSHRAWAVVVSIMIIWTSIRILKNYSTLISFKKTTLFWLLTLLVQLTLGAFVIWSGRAKYITTFHVPVGALTLGIGYYLFLQTHRLIAPLQVKDNEPVNHLSVETTTT